MFTKSFVERGCPEWFREIKEEPKEEFKWNDALACEWAGYLEQKMKILPPNEIPMLLDKWKQRKQSKSSSLPKQEGNSGLPLPSDYLFGEKIMVQRSGGSVHPLEPASDNSRDWEVVKMHDIKYDGYITNDNKLPMYSLLDYREKYEKGRFVIHSVKRPSDGVVWSIGDEFIFNGNKTQTPILGFELGYKNDHMLVKYFNGGIRLNKISKPEPSQQTNKERIEVSVAEDLVIRCLTLVYSSQPISKDKFPLIKQAIEQVLNNPNT